MTNLAPGKLGVFFYNAILVTIPTSLLLLAWYRHAVSRRMRVGAGASTWAWDEAKPSLADESAHARNSTAIPEKAVSATRRQVALIYGLGSLVAATTMTFLFALSMEFDLSGRAMFALWYVFIWPIVPTTVVLLALPQSRNILYMVVYGLIGAAVVAGLAWISAYVLGSATASPTKSAMFYANLLAQQLWLPYLIILMSGNRRLRPVSPLVLAGLLVFSFGSLLARDLYVAAVDAFPNATTWLLFPGSITFRLWYLLPALPIGYLCWLILNVLARSYETKRFNDVQLLVDSWWLIVVFQFCTELASSMGWMGLTGLLAFVGYRGTVEMGLRISRLDAERAGPTLLLLRVFGFQRRTEALFDRVAERWRFVGPVMMIAGADLAMRTLNPGDVISFISGRLKQRFIAGEEQVPQATAAIDMKPDPDGRFRTTKFYCHDNTWRATLTALMVGSDVVLMDLRGFSESNRGCLFELNQLISHELIPRTVFIVDQVTNVALLEQTVGQQALASGKAGAQPLQVRHLTQQSAAELLGVYEALQKVVRMRSSDSN